MRKIIKALFCIIPTILILMIIAGCGGIKSKIVDEVNKLWPPISISSERWATIQIAIEDLKTLTSPNVALSISSQELRKQLVSELTEKVTEISNVKIRFGNQLAKISADFYYNNEDPSFAVKGEMTGIITAAIDGTDLIVLPAFKSLHINKVDVDNVPDPNILLPILNKVLKALLININGEISRLPETRTALRIQPFDETDLAKIIKDKGTSGIVEVTSNIINGDFHLKRSSILFDEEKIQILGEMQYGGIFTPLPERHLDLRKEEIGEEQIESSYKELTVAFIEARRKVGADPPSNVIAWGAINKKFVSVTLNQALKDIQLHLKYDLSALPKQTFNDKLKPFNHAGIDCTPKIDCSGNAFPEGPYRPRDCTSRKDCSGNAFPEGPYSPRGCGGLDPFAKLDCERLKVQEKVEYEVRKETWKKACEAEKALEKGNCERLKAQEKAEYEVRKETWKKACEAEKALKKGGCEAKKIIVKGLENSGPLGRLIADANLSGMINIKIPKINFSQDLSEGWLDMGLAMDGVHMFGAIEFIPMGIIGHGVCMTKWKEPFKFNIQIPHEARKVNWVFGKQLEETAPAIPVTIPKHTFNITTDPPPVKEIFFEKPHLLLGCPFLVPIAALFDLANIVKGESDTGLFTGKFTLSMPEIRGLLLPLKPMEIKLRESVMTAQPVWQKDTITFTITKIP